MKNGAPRDELKDGRGRGCGWAIPYYRLLGHRKSASLSLMYAFSHLSLLPKPPTPTPIEGAQLTVEHTIATDRFFSKMLIWHKI